MRRRSAEGAALNWAGDTLTTLNPNATELLATARALATDVACAQVVQAWRVQGIHSIVLKGASIADWLYPAESRGYVDADLLVPPWQLTKATEAIRQLGFCPAADRISTHAHPWLRASDQAIIDLHVSLWGPTQSPAHVWDELQRWVEPHEIGGASVRVLSVPARALHVALHTAQHRDEPGRPRDLQRALERTTREQWLQAERLADRLQALPLMALGLSQEPAGRELLRQLPLARAALLTETEGATLAIGLARLAETPGVRAKTSLLIGALRAPDATREGRLASGPIDRLRQFARRLAWLLAGLAPTCRSLWRARNPD